MSPSTVVGYAAKVAGGPLKPFIYEAPPLGEQDVRVAVTHCGICYTDVHAIDDRYGLFGFPIVPGHEIVGNVSEVGRLVSDLKVGDRVGIGWQGRSCMNCEWCLQGEEQLCLDIVNDGTWTPYGGFSSSVVVDGRFAYIVPEAMLSESAAVLMCAGITVYSPLRTYVGERSQQIGIVGVGGLGHLAIQFAGAFGCEVTAISTTPGKEREARAFGADHFIRLGDEAAMRRAEYAFDLLLCPVHACTQWESLLEMVKKRGRVVLLGFPQLALDPTDLVAHELSMTGSFLGSRARMREMLKFAREHNIVPQVELTPMSQVNEAIRRVRDNQARYRIVLVNDIEP
jgi:alcohol/geraniol dehydrogenase (NADP+)